MIAFVTALRCDQRVADQRCARAPVLRTDESPCRTGPAKLELIDVSGRRWATRDVGSLGPGGHSVSFVGGGRIPPGIYLTRLTQGGQSLTRRVAVVQ